MPAHVVVRDYPEALPVLRGSGVDLSARGALPLEDAGPELPEKVFHALAWRERVGT